LFLVLPSAPVLACIESHDRSRDCLPAIAVPASFSALLMGTIFGN
jgi:hypothetical protein